ncbi:hypothetical protein HN51_047269 [Arachis hypogaea]
MVTVAGITDAALGADWINHHSYSASPSLSIISVLITTLKCKMGLFTYIQIKTIYTAAVSAKNWKWYVRIYFFLSPSGFLVLGKRDCRFWSPVTAFSLTDIFTDRISADSCFTSWSWSMCWNNCHVRNLSNGYGSRQDNCTGSIVGLNFAVYESLKDWLVKSNPFGLVQDSELSVTTRVACGAALGTVGQTVAYPL